MTTLGYPNIAFVGKAGSGKSSAAGILQGLALPGTPAMSYDRISFADPLRDAVEQIWGFDARTDRGLLQQFGQDVRDLDIDAWVLLWIRRLRATTWPVVVDDVRFENEWWAAKSEGFVIVRVWAPEHIRINRLKANGKWQDASKLLHESETAVDHMVVDYTIENIDGSLIDLAEALLAIINKELRRA